MKISRNLIISAILFVVVLIIYISTLCPTIYFGKPLEYVAQATGQSIVKPVSHPAWFFLAKLFKYITPSDPAYGLNILSAILGAWAVALLYLILANLSHDRTSEERQRFSHIPYLRQFSAVAGCLMLAFSPLYWGASVVAGPDTMKAFLMVLTGYFFVKYAFLKRKRYLLYFSIAYGVALANVPVMFFFIPVVFILMLVYCREIFEDAVAIGLSIGLFLIAFIPFVAVVPWSFAKEPPSYLLQPNVVQAFSYYQEWIYFDLKSILPVAMSPTYIAMWLLLLILPVFFPLIYLLWRKRSAAAASASISAIKYAMMLAFLGIGIAYMFGSDFYTIGYSSYIERLPPQYIVPLILVASWLTYTFGYWIVIICGRVAEGTPQGERYAAGYNKPVYSVLAVVVLLIPVVLFVLSLPDSNKRNETILRDFASDILASCEEGSVIVIPNAPDLKGSFYELGNALRYVNTYPSLGSEYAYSDVETVEKTIVDIPFAKRYAASGRIEFEIYLIYCIWQDE